MKKLLLPQDGHFKRSLRWRVLYYALFAYAGAIALKNVVQFFTAQSIINTYGSVSVELGLYYGLQTVVFEVGGAFLVAWLMVSWNRMSAKDAEGYGISLAFWENGLLLGVLPLINLLTYYLIPVNKYGLCCKPFYSTHELSARLV